LDKYVKENISQV